MKDDRRRRERVPERMARAELLALLHRERRAFAESLKAVHELEVQMLDLMAQNEQLRESLLLIESELVAMRIPPPASASLARRRAARGPFESSSTA